MRLIRKALLLGAQQGSGQVMFSLALVAVAGGVAAYMGEQNSRSIKEAQVQRSRDSSQQANTTNLPALAALMRFPSGLPVDQQVATNPDYLPSIYPDPYIAGSDSEVKLVAFKPATADARWSVDGSGGILVEGFNNARLSDTSLDQAFQSGATVATGTGAHSANSRVTFLSSVRNGILIEKIRVASAASVAQTAGGTAQDYLEAEMEVPPPPKPEVEVFGLPSSPLGYGQSATLSFKGSGVMTGVSIAPANNPGAACTPSLPADAKSIRGRGYALGSCGVSFQAPDVVQNDSDAVGYISVVVTAVGPGGTNQKTILVPAHRPPTCRFVPSSYSTQTRAPVGIYMAVSGSVTGTPQMEIPVNNTVNSYDNRERGNWGWQHVGGWQGTSGAGANLWGAVFDPGVQNGVADIWGRVTGPALAPNTWQGCTDTATVNIGQTVCREHTMDEGSNYFYLGQCYQHHNGSFVVWDAPGPSYNYCQGKVCPAESGGCGCEIFDPRSEGCFSPETQIQMADGSSRRIDSLRAGDQVYNPLTHRSSRIKGLVKGPEAEPMIELGYDGKLVHVTTKHAFLTRSGVKAAKDLSPGEHLVGTDGKLHKLTDLRRLPVDPAQQVYNFVVDDPNDSPTHHVVVADGILTGDLQVQQDLAKGAANVSKFTANSVSAAK